MKVVYWSPWDFKDMYNEMYLGYTDPINVFNDISKSINKENKMDNFLNCPAFVNSAKNTFLFTSPTNADLTFIDGHIKNNLPDHIPFNQRTFVFKSPSLLNARTVRLAANWIFFSEDDLEMESIHPYMHSSPVTDYGYYVPGSFNINKWFRPLEYAFQMKPNCDNFKVSQGDPLMYVKFNTKEKVELRKFHLSDKLFDMSMSCIRLKSYWRQRQLSKLYELFVNAKMNKSILNEIKKNLV